VSRGVDLDLYDVLIMYHSNFSTPYWSIMMEYWKEQLQNAKEYGRKSGSNVQRNLNFIEQFEKTYLLMRL